MWKDILAFVPQGSVLAPLLFLILFNDLPHSVPLLDSLMYADDIVLYPRSNTQANITPTISLHQLIDSLPLLLQWSCQWKFIINGPKSAAMAFCDYRRLNSREPTGWKNPIIVQHPHHPNYNISIRRVKQYQYLGLILTSNLSWTPHTKYVMNKASTASYHIARIVNTTPVGPPSFHVIRRLVNACVLPILTYGLPIWSPSPSRTGSINSILARPLLRALALPGNAEHLATLVYSAVLGMPALLHQSTIRVCRLFALRPAFHPTAELWSHEQNNDFTDALSQHPNLFLKRHKNMSSISKHLRNAWAFICNNDNNLPSFYACSNIINSYQSTFPQSDSRPK